MAKIDLDALNINELAALRDRAIEKLAEKVAARLKSGQGVTFMAVGAAHLVGRDSVQKTLEARGISVARQ